MRLLIRILPKGLAALALLLSLAIIVFWARSHGAADLVWWRWRGANYQVESLRGGVIVMRLRVLTHDRAPGVQTLAPAHMTTKGAGGRFFTWLLPAEGGWCQTRGGAFTVPRRTFGFQYASAGNGAVRLLRIPYPAIFALAAAIPFAYLARSVVASHRLRYRFGEFCRSCGYDLRATPDRCPECGAVPDREEAAKARPA